MKDAGQHFERSQSAMSEMIDRHVKRGLLVRVKDEKDKRSHLVWLTNAGTKLVAEESEPLDAQRVMSALAQLSPEQNRHA